MFEESSSKVSGTCQMKGQHDVIIHAPLVEMLTPSTCSKIIAEIVKYILYQKQQIPYTYDHMRNIAMKYACISRHEWAPGLETGLQSPTLGGATSRERKAILFEERRNKQTIQSYETFELIFKNLELELQANSRNSVKEVVLVMGTTPMSPREVYRIQLPSLVSDYHDKPSNERQSLLQLIRSLAMSNDLNDIFGRSMAPTNTYLYLKMNKLGETSNWFLPKPRYNLPTRGQQVVISVGRQEKESDCPNLLGVTLNTSCGFLIHQDVTETTETDQAYPKVHLCGALEDSKLQQSNGSRCEGHLVGVDFVGIHWYQSPLVLKGFKS